MSKIINIECSNCKEDFTTEPYFYGADIIVRDDGFNNHRRHIATVNAKAICPHCGTTNTKLCECEVYENDIIDLAIRRHKRG